MGYYLPDRGRQPRQSARIPVLEEDATVPAISVTGLSKRYGQIKAVDDISLEVHQDEIFGILGPNGAGKTTTLEMIETLREPDSGEIRVMGFDVAREPLPVKEILGVQLQTTVFFDNLTVRETIDLFASFYTKALPRDEVLGLVGLSDRSSAMVEELSGGQHKRLSIALALVNDPGIVFLDEPTTGLDPQARRRIWEIIEAFRRQHKTVVLTTHYIEEAEHLCDRVAVMDHGRVIALGSPSELISLHISESSISFTLTPPLDEGVLDGIPGAVGVSSRNGEYVLTTTNAKESLMGLFKVAYENGSVPDGVSMKKATLEDVFLKLTGRSLRE